VPLWLSARAALAVIGAAIALGSLIRLAAVLGSDFPLNDGGMFYAMARDLQANGYRLPDETSYNTAGIPFAYPPLGFYLAAAMDSLTPLSLIDTFRFLPLALSVATMGAFALLARRLLSDRLASAAAAAAFALTPSSFLWMIMGGGVTRSLGMLLAVLALVEAHRLYTTRSRVRILTLGILAGLTVLSHIELAWVMTFSVALLMVSFDRTRRGVIHTLPAAGVALAVAAPWLIAVVAQHGVEPFLAAITTGAPAQSHPLVVFLLFQPTREPLFTVIAALALVGALWSIVRGQWLLPAWLLACGLLDPRGFPNVATLPCALLAGVAVSSVLVPMLNTQDALPATGTARSRALPIVVVGLLGIYALLGAAVAATTGYLRGLDPDDRAAMVWVRDHTPAGSGVLVVTDEEWPRDRVSEWFPVLAQRHSVATVQGYEWLRDARGAFAPKVDAYRDAQLCGEATSACIDDWAIEQQAPFDYVYLPKLAEYQRGPVDHPDECCGTLRLSLLGDPRYEVVFDGPGATVFARIQEPSSIIR
jgi:hypothetical protein